MIFIITRHATHATIDCPVAGNTVLHGTPAVMHGKNWYIETADIPAATARIREAGHTALTPTAPITDTDKVPIHCPHGIRWGHLLDAENVSVGGCTQCEWRDEDTGNLTAPNAPGARPFTYGWWLLWCQRNRPPGAEAERRRLLAEIGRGEATPEAMRDLIESQKRRARSFATSKAPDATQDGTGHHRPRARDNANHPQNSHPTED